MSAPARNTPIVDGVDRTMMIAAETTRTAAIIFPYRCVVEGDVADWAHLGTLAAVDADVGIDGELPVSNHEAVEVGADDVGERPGR